MPTTSNNNINYTPHTCLPTKPLVELGEGEAPKLNYNLPASTAFELKNVIPLKIAEALFKRIYSVKQEKNVWSRAKDLSQEEVLKECIGLFDGVKSAYGIFVNQQLLKGVVIPFENQTEVRNFKDNPFQTIPRFSNKEAEVKWLNGNGNYHVKTANRTPISPKFGNPYQMAQYIKEGYIPFFFRNFAGEIDIEYRCEPILYPRIYLIEHLRVSNHLGDYGAGKTIGTFSLFAGEKSSISITSYSKKEITKAKAENVLDSFSNNSANTLEHTLQSELQSKLGDESSNTNSNNVTSSGGTTTTSQSNWGQTGQWEAGGGLSFTVPDLFSIGGGGGGGGSNTTGGGTGSQTTSGGSTSADHISTLNSVREQLNNTLQNAIDKTVSESSAHRQVEVNTTSTESYTEGNETTTIRQIENTNFSRTLNFVFRQMSQQYLSITYLHDVSFVFTNGHPDSKITVKLDGLEQLLLEVLENAEDVDNVLNDLLKDLCSVVDYEGTKRQFAKCDTVELINCCNGNSEDPESVTVQHFLHKNPACVQTVNGIAIKGVVLDVRERILPVEHVIVDALLGQGEALDCYNQRLQNSIAEKEEIANHLTLLEAQNRQSELQIELQKQQFELQKAQAEAALEQAKMQLEIDKQTQAMAIIDLLTDAVQKAELYKKVFGNCCDTPQTQVIS